MQLEIAQKIVAAALASARSHKFKPLAVVVLDARGALQGGCRRGRHQPEARRDRHRQGARRTRHGTWIAHARSHARSQQPQFMAAVTHAVGGSLIPVPGGVLINDSAGTLLGAVGVSGDTSDNDEIAAMAGIEAAGCKGDPGA